MLAWLVPCGALLLLGLFLVHEGLDRADKWASVLGFP
jgi:hypothetical protein